MTQTDSEDTEVAARPSPSESPKGSEAVAERSAAVAALCAQLPPSPQLLGVLQDIVAQLQVRLGQEPSPRAELGRSAAAGEEIAAAELVLQQANGIARVDELQRELEAAREQAAHLATALESNRDIGAATGILMARHHLTQPQAFDLLRQASQTRHVKLRDLAREVLYTGMLDLRTVGDEAQ